MTDAISRNAVVKRGPFFYKDGEQVMFVCILDRSSSVGPVPVEDKHKEAYPAAWRAFETGDVAGAL